MKKFLITYKCGLVQGQLIVEAGTEASALGQFYRRMQFMNKQATVLSVEVQ